MNYFFIVWCFFGWFVFFNIDCLDMCELLSEYSLDLGWDFDILRFFFVMVIRFYFFWGGSMIILY